MPGVPAEFWERSASGYDRQRWLQRAAIRLAVDLLVAGPEDMTLDVATGTGVVLAELAGRPRRPAAVTGVDTSPAMLAEVGALPPGWRTVVGDATAMPFAAGSFDAACAAYLLQVVAPADRPTIARELFRVLRPGGRLVTVVPTIPPSGVARPPARLLDGLARLAPVRLGGLTALDVRPLLADAGFEVLDARVSTRGYPSQVVLAER